MKVYIVRVYDMCECDDPCACVGYSIDDIFASEDAAKKRAEERFRAEVVEYTVQ